MTQPFIKLRSATEHCQSHGGVHTAAQNLNPNVRAELSETKGATMRPLSGDSARAQTNADTVAQFTAQVDRFLTSPHVNEPEAVRRFLAAVDPRCYESALDVACGPGLLARPEPATTFRSAGG